MLTAWSGLGFGMALALLPSCSGRRDIFMGSAAAGGGSGEASQGAGGGIPTGRGGSSGSGGMATAGTGGDSCAGTPCADHQGDEDFIEDGAPQDAPELFEGGDVHESGADAAREPALVYPSDETMFPINVARIRHDWRAGGSNGLFRLRFEGERTTVDVYTVAETWQPSAEQWDWIAESNRGGEVKLTVSGLDPADPGDVWQSRTVRLYFSAAEVEGAIYYWSTGTKGVMKALVADPIPVKFYTDPSAADAGTCVACHTLSRDGKRLAVGYDGETLREVSVPERRTILPVDGGTGGGATTEPPPMGDKGGMPDKGMMPGKGMPSAWTTFSPDGEQLLVAANGILTLIDSDTGEPIGDDGGIVPIPEGTIATHPDWSALGDRVAITLGKSGGNKEVEGGAIAILPYEGGAWGEPEILVPNSGGDDNNFFPVWSPDSKFIAYVNAAGKSKDATSATLRLVAAQGGDPILLTRVNERVNDADGVTGIGNSMPTWAPSTKPGTFWIAFSSLRAYSIVREQDPKEDQIWIAAIDPALEDPAYAAFWAPFQNIDDGNHRAFWTHSDEDRQCGCQDACGDGLDNDCDGAADEDDCAVCEAAEVCGDGIDNDCDCVVDECSGEICGDGIDNDGDGQADSADSACEPR
ncbi:MAG TPA: MopE-related protein [Polyangiaceae bacterium]